MRLNQFHRCLLSLQGKSPLAVSQGYQPPPTDWTDVIVTSLGMALVIILGVIV